MASDWLIHDSHNPFYREPFGAAPCGASVRLRLAVRGGTGGAVPVLRLGKEHKDGTEEEKIRMSPWAGKGGPEGWAVYEATLILPEEPGLVWYYFIAERDGRTFFLGNNADTLGGRGVVAEAEPPSFQITVFRKGLTTPAWFKHRVMYQIFVDRFYNGHPDGRVENVPPDGVVHAHWDGFPFYVRDPDTGRIMAYDFYGGNLAGVMAKLPYLKELGVGVIYFNPIFRSPSNHKYDTADYKTIDPMYGDNAGFAALCQAAREMGIAIILDGVFSHTGSDSIYFNRYGTYPELGAFQSKESPYYSWYRFIEWPEKYESWWGIDTLPNVNELEPSYLDFIIEGQDSVIKLWHGLGASGWRLDVADELPDEFLERLRRRLKELDPEAVLIGEVWEDASRKVSYGVLRRYLWGDELDSTMNYPFRTALLDFALGRADAARTHAVLMSLKENYPVAHFYSLMNLIGSHDRPRILTLLGEAPPPESLTREEQARYRLPPDKRRLAVKRLKMLVLWQMTFPGVPSIYYGDEAGMQGYADPFNRGPYPWGREDRELQEWHRRAAAIRNRHAVLRTGNWHSIVPGNAGGDVYGYIRSTAGGRDVFGEPVPDNLAVALFNRSADAAREVAVDLSAWPDATVLTDMMLDRRRYKAAGGRLTVRLRPLEGKLLLKCPGPFRRRQCGILLHPTSLPGRYGIGDLGPEACRFVDFLRSARQDWWQVLPINPVGYGESPYQALSAFAGNHLLLSPDGLLEDGLLTPDEIEQESAKTYPADKIDFEAVIPAKERLLRRAFARFAARPRPAGYREFCAAAAAWLEDYALFMALKKHYNGRPWTKWDRPAAFRDPQALAMWRERLAPECEFQRFLQYAFHKQWTALRRYANSSGIKIVGDMPLFVAHDSADVWAHPELFKLDENGEPAVVAGVPPDYFSATGQRWGNPLYRWDRMAEDGYAWWRARFETLLGLVDLVRIDHFRGLEAAWEVPASEKTAENGEWVAGPGAAFFAALERHLGKLPVIAEDLGVITPPVVELRERFGFPGMQILQFSLWRDEDGESAPFAPGPATVAYTGTHDNDTTLSWFRKLQAADPEAAAAVARYAGIGPRDDDFTTAWRFIELLYQSSAGAVVVPLQDVLALGGEARMNFPGTAGGNWRWRCPAGVPWRDLAKRLADLVAVYGDIMEATPW